MSALPEEQFVKLNLMAGTARRLEQELLSDDDAESGTDPSGSKSPSSAWRVRLPRLCRDNIGSV